LHRRKFWGNAPPHHGLKKNYLPTGEKDAGKGQSKKNRQSMKNENWHHSTVKFQLKIRLEGLIISLPERGQSVAKMVSGGALGQTRNPTGRGSRGAPSEKEMCGGKKTNIIGGCTSSKSSEKATEKGATGVRERAHGTQSTIT